jgi:hypothetical protein
VSIDQLAEVDAAYFARRDANVIAELGRELEISRARGARTDRLEAHLTQLQAGTR